MEKFAFRISSIILSVDSQIIRTARDLILYLGFGVSFAGLFFLDWEALPTIMINICETLILLFFFFVKALIRVRAGEKFDIKLAAILVPFVLLFALAQSFFAGMLFTSAGPNRVERAFTSLSAATASQAFWLLCIALTHLFQLIYLLRLENFKLSGEYLVGDFFSLMKRTGIMQFTIIFGGFLSLFFRSPILGAALILGVQCFENFRMTKSIQNNSH